MYSDPKIMERLENKDEGTETWETQNTTIMDKNIMILAKLAENQRQIAEKQK